uniref:hypothetical protein n=1 Tax=Acetatifactor sp. TaxID=1872090 RepID=UPI004056F96D
MAYNKNTLFNIKVNTYICRELYRKCGNYRNEQFITEESRNLPKGKKKKYAGWNEIIYGLNVSESKVQRIVSGNGASFFTKEEAKIIGETFNIDSKYFAADYSILLPVSAIEIDEWKVFLTQEYDLGYVNRKIGHIEYEALKGKISKALDKIISDYRNELINTTSALYRICWYYEKGKTFEDKDIQIRVRNRVQEVHNTETFEWSQCSDGDIEQFIDDLNETLEFLKAYKICRTKFKI